MELMEIFDFNAADLEANRRGELTARQRQRLETIMAGGRRAASPALIVGIVVVFFVVAGWIVFGRGNQPREVVLIFAGLVLVDLMVLPVVLMSAFRRQRRARERMTHSLEAGSVLPLRGVVHAGEIQAAYSPADTRQVGGYAVSVAGQRLLFNTSHPEALTAAIIPEQIYTVFCFDTGSGKYLLSIEPG